MGSEKDRASDMGDAEDIPSDFFDDFTKDDFMDGLSVIDSWDDEDKTGKRRDSARRIDSESLDKVKDLRELIGDSGKDIDKTKTEQSGPFVKFDDRFKWQKRDSSRAGSSSSINLDNFIKPGSRRDPSKTNEAIKKDKEVKVKEYLAKHLESGDDLRPPGTELDDYYDEEKTRDRKRTPKHVEEEETEHPLERRLSPRPHYKQTVRHFSPHRPSPRQRRSPRWSPHYTPRRSPHYMPRRSPHHMPRHSPHRQFKRFSPPPQNVFRKRYSPQRRSPPRRSPRRYSPMRSRAQSPRRRRPSRSPFRSEHRPSNYEYDRRSRSPRSHSARRTDTFLYPSDPHSTQTYAPETYVPEPGHAYPAPAPAQNEYPGSVPGYSYSQNLAYGNSYTANYNYAVQPVPPCNLPGSAPMPILNPVPAPVLEPVAAPAMVPAPTLPVLEQKTPYDALAQLLAEGKISQEDYLKLAPNKGASSSVESKVMSGVMTRCNQALTKLEKLLLPSHLMMNNHIIGSEPKSLESKFCSPLKRQAVIEFSFTKTNRQTVAQQNKQLVESIITTIGLDKMVSKYKKTLPKDMKDAAVQTSKPYCDVCEIRESTKVIEADTATDPKYFTSTVHTQVVEQDLVNSKTVFNPSGSVADGAPISIAHLTPAQLVSQLAARAKTLQQTPPAPPGHQNQFGRRNPNYDYDGRGGGGGQQYHHNYNNYRY